ncbi:MAG: pentapeptide repeat-containing protein [Campylobacteraceae bacterium]|nr:pentapeptide repeat-containing protein [Campylobacteraceae bacterium]
MAEPIFEFIDNILGQERCKFKGTVYKIIREEFTDNRFIRYGNQKYALIDNKKQIESRIKTAKLSLNFQNCIFTEYADFGFQLFSKHVNFIGATFTKNADFRKTVFEEDASFRFATFMKDAYFRDSVFEKEAYFDSTIFLQETYFGHADFFNYTSFKGAIINTFNLSNLITHEKFRLDLSFSQIGMMYYQNTNFKKTDTKETFLILKQAALKQHDQINALDFYKKEMQAHKDSLEWCSRDCLDKLVLSFERLSSNYGTNGIISILWVFAITFLFSGLMVGTYSLEVFLHIINPLTKFNDIADTLVCNTTLNHTLFIFHKLSLAVLIYETIKSFRKFSRKL